MTKSYGPNITNASSSTDEDIFDEESNNDCKCDSPGCYGQRNGGSECHPRSITPVEQPAGPVSAGQSTRANEYSGDSIGCHAPSYCSSTYCYCGAMTVESDTATSGTATVAPIVNSAGPVPAVESIRAKAEVSGSTAMSVNFIEER